MPTAPTPTIDPITTLVASAPPLTEQQLHTLGSLLGGVR